MTDFPYKTPALRVEQRLGIFYVVALPVKLLLEVASSDETRATMNPKEKSYDIGGAQRFIKNQRLREITSYINRIDSIFPNSIILAANHDFETDFDQGEAEYIREEDIQSQDKSFSWTVKEFEHGCHEMTIPSPKRLVAIIDGQHRLFAFKEADIEVVENTCLPCSVFLELPKAWQAHIFATINSTQKRVDRSLTYELFGYNVSDESKEFWTPDKLAVFLTRKLGAGEDDSPLKGKIKIAPKQDDALKKITSEMSWHVSTATVVDGILRLFSSSPRKDADVMRKDKAHPREILKDGRKDNSPLRQEFVESNDLLIYTMVLNYLKASDEIFWKNADEDSFIIRTIGVQAIFDILRLIAKESLEAKDISVEYFLKELDGARKINFSRDVINSASGAGRTAIRKMIGKAIGIER